MSAPSRAPPYVSQDVIPSKQNPRGISMAPDIVQTSPPPRENPRKRRPMLPVRCPSLDVKVDLRWRPVYGGIAARPFPLRSLEPLPSTDDRRLLQSRSSPPKACSSRRLLPLASPRCSPAPACAAPDLPRCAARFAACRFCAEQAVFPAGELSAMVAHRPFRHRRQGRRRCRGRRRWFPARAARPLFG